jgi:TatD DNase family protein
VVEGLCYATVGVHPCTAKSFDTYPAGPTAMLNALKELARSSAAEGHTVAFGEIGLDYDRLFMSPKDQQLKYFEAQLDVATELQLPLFLHMRAAAEDFERLLKPRLSNLPKSGLVHSFTGSLEEMRSLVDLGLHIGVNGCSLKTEENLLVVKEIPLDRLHVETDGPWVRARHLTCCRELTIIVRNAALTCVVQTAKRHRAIAKGSQKRKMGKGDDGKGQK